MKKSTTTKNINKTNVIPPLAGPAAAANTIPPVFHQIINAIENDKKTDPKNENSLPIREHNPIINNPIFDQFCSLFEEHNHIYEYPDHSTDNTHSTTNNINIIPTKSTNIHNNPLIEITNFILNECDNINKILSNDAKSIVQKEEDSPGDTPTRLVAEAAERMVKTA